MMKTTAVQLVTTEICAIVLTRESILYLLSLVLTTFHSRELFFSLYTALMQPAVLINRFRDELHFRYFLDNKKSILTI